MKLKYLSIAISAALIGLSSCQPDEYSLGGSQYTVDDLQQGLNYSVKPDAENPNIIHLSTSVTGVTPSGFLLMAAQVRRVRLISTSPSRASILSLSASQRQLVSFMVSLISSLL